MIIKTAVYGNFYCPVFLFDGTIATRKYAWTGEGATAAEALD